MNDGDEKLGPIFNSRFQQLFQGIAEIKQQIHHLEVHLTEELKKIHASPALQDGLPTKDQGRAKRKTDKK